jgi:hypothetical protein
VRGTVDHVLLKQPRPQLGQLLLRLLPFGMPLAVGQLKVVLVVRAFVEQTPITGEILVQLLQLAL